MKNFLLLLFLNLALASCGIYNYGNDYYDENYYNTTNRSYSSPEDSNISKDTTYLTLTVFQTLDPQSALAFNRNFDVVKIETSSDIYYDGKKIAGLFVMDGTYTYQAKNEIVKTVPVFRLKNDTRKEQGKSIYLSMEIFQTISQNEALATTDDGSLIKIESATETYYDRKHLSGYFTLIWIYTYETVKKEIKTIPVYIRTSEYKEIMGNP